MFHWQEMLIFSGHHWCPRHGSIPEQEAGKQQTPAGQTGFVRSEHCGTRPRAGSTCCPTPAWGVSPPEHVTAQTLGWVWRAI